MYKDLYPTSDLYLYCILNHHQPLGLDRLSKAEREDLAARDFLLKTATTLRLEFRLILKVGQGFHISEGY